MELIFLIPTFLCWGSFLNVVAYRLIYGGDIIWQRSACPNCSHILAWYDLIPLVSWIMVRGRCRYCKGPISALYPFIELLTTLTMMLLYERVPHHFFPAYFLFFSALIVTIRSDLQTMLISRFATLYLIPVGIGMCAVGLLPLSVIDGIIGALFGYGCLYTISALYQGVTGKQGIGQGDLELLAFIGAWVGIDGCWMSLLIGSVLGSFVGVGYVLITRSDLSVKIPFGPFLATGALMFVLLQEKCLQVMLFGW